ncbi:serine hydrolase domain-containing protein [Phytomonospora endophytica]|uniref:CubicO group peptidase (Beta-lactamase class C family) n=1 Tax=Phytomonospora endophytica TaxID=714109 RepID=A0A841G166_9ACTN|nr:serine hydrolase domain-containing protein [Phytomonospora endophytica]MBB6038419.1 CubicO group peptidase (beta-lactamase class C family) [Phytomonospora endophytica]GIG64348.1 serine hydrolase [Phytomonospora endophytica]
MTTTEVHGTVAAGYEKVRDAFTTAVTAEEDLGAQLAVYAEGKPVVDLWSGPGVDGDSLFINYSSAKGAAHLVAALLVQDGAIDLDATVAGHWPEFAAEGKGRVTFRELIAHRAGLIGVDGGFTVAELADDRALAARLAGQKPYWEPGTGFGYHAYVIGALTGEVIRRVTGRTIQEWYEERIRVPYGLDYHLGLPSELEARFVPVEEMRETPPAGPDPQSLTGIAFNLNHPEPTSLVDYGNSRLVHAGGPTSSGGVGNARGLARMYAATLSEVDGRERLLRPETIAEFAGISMTGTDLVTGQPDHFGLGFEAVAARYTAVGPDAFGHSGATGSYSLADPRSGVGYSYLRNRFSAGGGGGSPENGEILRAVVEAAG